MFIFLQQIINGIALGSMYSLVATGMTMIYGMLRVLHIAHAGVMGLGAFIGVVIYAHLGNFLIALPAAMLLAGLFGVLIEKFLYRPMLTLSRIVPLIASIGLFELLRDLYRVVFGPEDRPFPVEVKASFDWGVFHFSGIQMLILSIVVIIIGLLFSFMYRTKTGFAVRAIAQSIDVSQAMGINVNGTVQIVFFIGSAMAAAAGVLNGVYYNNVTPQMADVFAYKALAVIVIGGFGSVVGTIIGGMTLGVMETIMLTYFNIPLSREGLALFFMVMLMLFRPSGLLGKG